MDPIINLHRPADSTFSTLGYVRTHVRPLLRRNWWSETKNGTPSLLCEPLHKQRTG